jgi:DNA ligase-1
MLAFAQTCAAIRATTSKLEKTAALAAYFRALDDADLVAAARFFTGNAFAHRDQKQLSIGGRTIVEAAKRAWGVTDAQLSAGYREHGDLGETLGPLVREPAELALFRDRLTPASLAAIFEEIAAASGKSAGRRRALLCERILGACSDPLEATYTIKVMTGELRIGLKEGLVHDAIANAFDEPAAAVRRGAMIAGDVGEVALAAKAHRLGDLHVRFGAPLGFMLASPVPYGEAYPDLRDEQWIAEDKYDGIRAQAHVDGERIVLYSRTMNDVTLSYPEIERGLRLQRRRMILDGEIVASRDGRMLPFRTLQARLQRKEIDPSLLADVPLAYVVFDLLALDDEIVLDEPLHARRERLTEALEPNAHVVLAPSSPVDEASVNERFEAARAAGNEGLMLKRIDAPYVTGRRGKWWLKLKRELTTLDVVVVGVEWGHGKRAKVLSDYTFAVRGPNGDLLTIGKAYTGLTDAEIAELTPWFLAHKLEGGERRYGRAFAVEPTLVIEVAFDIIQRSDLHQSGYAMRFPRIVRLRLDKPASEIDTLARVDEIYEAMLKREGV